MEAENETQKACPNCGHCPSCGRSNPYRTAPPWQPYTPVFPPNWPPNTWITWGGNTTNPYPTYGTTTGNALSC